MLSEGVKKKPLGAEYSKQRAKRKCKFEECEMSMNLQKYFKSQSTENETCKQGEASTSVSSMNRFKLGVTNTYYNVERN
jgi:hypothetical protein